MWSIQSIINKASKKNRTPNILMFCYDGAFDLLLAKTGYNFYCVMEHSSYDWRFLTNCCPPNLKIISGEDIFKHDYDLIIINNREKNINNILHYQMYFQLPVIVIDQEPATKNKYISIKSIPSNLLTIGTSNSISKSYGHENVMVPSYPLRDITEKTNDILLMGNFAEQNYYSIRSLMSLTSNSILVGDNPGLPCIIPESEQHLNSIFDNTKIFINLATKKNICCNVMRALSSHCKVISLGKHPTGELLRNSDNFYQAETVDQIEEIYLDILNKPIRENIDDGYKSFIEGWTNIIDFYRDKIWIK